MSSLARDLKSAIGAVLASLSELQERVEHGTVADADFSEIIRSLEQAGDAADALLDLAQPRHDRRLVHLNRFVSQIEPLLHQAAGPARLLTLRLSASVGAIIADPAELTRVLVTLLAGARESTPKGGEIVLDTAQVACLGNLPADQPCPGEHVRISITDTGIGSRKEAQARVLAQTATPDDDDEAPAHRPSVADIVRDLGGWILLENDLGRGTRVHICLPVAP